MASQTRKKQQKPPKRISHDYLRNAGRAYLERFTASRAHFHDVMMRKVRRSLAYHTDQDEEECRVLVDKFVEEMVQAGYINDHNYAHGFVTSLRRKGMGENAIRMKLKQKGVEHDLIDVALETVDADIHKDIENAMNEADFSTPASIHDRADFIAALRLARRKKIGPFKGRSHSPPPGQAAPRQTGPDALRQTNRDLGLMARAGFSYEIATKILNLPPEDAEFILLQVE